MAQKQFSESLVEFTGKVENHQLADSIAGLKELVGIRNLRFFQWDEQMIALAVEIPVELPPLGNFENIDIRSVEPVLIKVHLVDYPTTPPMVFPDRLDFPKDSLAHLYIARKGKPPGFCLVRGDIAEWYSNKRLKDLYIRTGNWLQDAALGQLTEDGEQFDPIRLEGYVGTMIYDYDQVANIVNEKQSYVAGTNFSIALFERMGGTSIGLKLTRFVTPDNLESSVQELRKEREKSDSTPSKKNYHFGYLLWSDSETTFNKYSVDFPEDWNSFKHFCAEYGIPVSHLEKQVVENDKNIFVTIPVIIGIRRPKKIIGFSSDIEFINFTIKVDTTDVDAGTIVNNVPVNFYKHGQPLSLEKAKQISGEQVNLGKYSLVVGCGALGSKVIMHFARSGATKYILTDPDEISPHNMVRHALLGNSEGLGKADALKKEINSIFPYDKMPMLISSKVLGSAFLEPELSKFFNWILDFTASNAFAQTVTNTKFETIPRIAKAHITDFGKLGITYFEGKDRNPRLDDLQVMLYAQYENDPFIAEWLQREAENTTESNNLSITIGVGCNSETTVLSDDIVSLHSAFAANVIKSESLNEKPDDGRIYINEVRHEPFFSNFPRLIKLPPMEVLTAINDPSWQIRMKPGILETMKCEMGLRMPSETGGVFVGCANYKTKTIHITNLIKAPADSTANEVCFFRGVEGLPDTIREINHSTGNQLGYIGEWHTHPFGPNQLSTTDANTIKKFKKDFSTLQTPLPVFLMIVTPTHVLAICLLKNIISMFDNYTLKARYYPVIILFLPIIMLGFFYSLQFDSIFHFLVSVGVVGALTYLFSQLGRDQGKRKEAALWDGWGGMPSLQLLRLSHQHIDKHTKQRYHKKLQSPCPVPFAPDDEMEEKNPSGADDIYKAWTKYLISQTRDGQKFSLLLKENTSYGFRRNLWGLRPFAIELALISLVANYFFWVYKMEVFNPLKFPQSFVYSSIAILAIILFWVSVVTKRWVKLVAFSYAERLCECVDNL